MLCLRIADRSCEVIVGRSWFPKLSPGRPVRVHRLMQVRLQSCSPWLRTARGAGEAGSYVRNGGAGRRPNDLHHCGKRRFLSSRKRKQYRIAKMAGGIDFQMRPKS